MKQYNNETIKIFFLGSPLFTLLLLAGILISSYKLVTYKVIETPGISVPIIPEKELANGEKHAKYNSIPPTSGWYLKRPLRDGIFTSVIPDEQIVYALKEGKVGIFYNCNYGTDKKSTNFSPQNSALQNPSNPSISSNPSSTSSSQTLDQQMAVYAEVNRQNQSCGNLIAQLRKVVTKEGTTNLLLAPYGKLDGKIALVAWGKIDKMRWVDEKRITDFVNAYRKKLNPEPE